jgi:hypothetical protein
MSKSALYERNVIFIRIFVNKMTHKNGETTPLCLDA